MSQQPLWIPYCGAAPLPAEWLARWNFDPLLLTALGLFAAVGFVWGRRDRRPLMAAALILALVLFVSPFCALTSALFSARVVHHVVLAAVLAPLLVAAFPFERLRIGSPAVWTGIQALVFWSWHAPPLYAWALSSDGAYWLMQATLLGSATVFWAGVQRAQVTSAVGALLATMVQMGLLGALLTFSGTAFYAPHLFSTQPWGLTPLDDQQLAGLIMWVPAAGFYLGAAVWLGARWFARAGRTAALR